MTVALVLAAQPDAGLRGQLAALGVRRVDAAERAGPGLLTVAAAALAAGERVLICVGDDSLPEEVLARLLGAGRTAAFTGTGNGAGTGTGNRNGSQAPETQAAHRAAYSGGGALVVYPSDLAALEDAAESLARRRAAPAELGVLLGELSERGVGIRVLDAGPEGDGPAMSHCDCIRDSASAGQLGSHGSRKLRERARRLAQASQSPRSGARR